MQFTGPDCISKADLGVVGIVMYISGCMGTAFALLLPALVAYFIMKHCSRKVCVCMSVCTYEEYTFVNIWMVCSTVHYIIH